MAEQSSSAGQAGQAGLGEDSPCKEGEQMAPASSPVEKGKAAVGGPSGLLLTTTLNTSIGFTGKAAPPLLRRSSKTRVLSSPSPTINDGSIVIDMEAALRAVAGKLAVARVLSPYPVYPQNVVNELCGPWRLRGEAVAQQVTSEDGRFVITFSEEGDRLHVVQAGPWHYRNDAVLIAEFDGNGNPADMPLVSFKIWVQIRDLPVPIKTEEMGWILGAKLGTVVAVSHKIKKIVDKNLRVRIEHKVDEPLRKYIDTTPVGSTNKILFDVKYEKLPNFCFCCGIVGHTTTKFCGIPSE